MNKNTKLHKYIYIYILYFNILYILYMYMYQGCLLAVRDEI